MDKKRELIDSTDYMKVSEQLYREQNPTSKMDTPNSVYETTHVWFKEWCMIETDLNFYDWCKSNKK